MIHFTHTESKSFFVVVQIDDLAIGSDSHQLFSKKQQIQTQIQTKTRNHTQEFEQLRQYRYELLK